MRKHNEATRDVRHFGERLRLARKTASLTQEQLANKAGIDRTIILRIEAGERPPRFHQLLALHDALGFKRGHLLAP